MTRAKGGGGWDDLGAALPKCVEGGTGHNVQHAGQAAGGGGGAGGAHQEVVLPHDGPGGILEQPAPPPQSPKP